MNLEYLKYQWHSTTVLLCLMYLIRPNGLQSTPLRWTELPCCLKRFFCRTLQTYVWWSVIAVYIALLRISWLINLHLMNQVSSYMQRQSSTHYSPSQWFVPGMRDFKFLGGLGFVTVLTSCVFGAENRATVVLIGQTKIFGLTRSGLKKHWPRWFKYSKCVRKNADASCVRWHGVWTVWTVDIAADTSSPRIPRMLTVWSLIVCSWHLRSRLSVRHADYV